MAKEVTYNNTLVSGAADETLTYTRYIKDEGSGKSTKELLDEKVNKTDQLGTTQIADKAVTTEKLAEHSVDNSKLSQDSVSYDKIQNDAVITEKIQNGAVTTEKVEEKAVTNQKLGDQSVDGRVVREASLETKHFANESVTTEKVARKSITKDKLADNAVDASQVVDGSIGNAKLSPDSVTTEKIKDGSVTKEKVADNTIGIEKFDPELRKTIQAATGLPEDLNQMIQDVDQSVKQLHEKDADLQTQIDDKQQQITANDDDISLLQTRSTQMEEAIKGISASGGASQATAVTYENTESGLDSVTAQGAIDELANKKFNKENIAQEFGDSENKVVSQFALPFREIESLEFINAIVDAENHFLFGIQIDGSIEWGKGIPAPIRAKLQEIINQCHQDKTDILEAINAAKKELSASITALQESKVDIEEGKSLIDDEVKECFKVIENEEFIHAVIDAENRLLFAIYRDSGKPYFPLNEMYHVEQNEEFFAVWLDADDKVLLGIRRDGQIIGEIHAVNALKQVISSLQEKVDIIDASLQELLDVFSLQENPEYLAVEKDADGKILSSTNPDGSHYIYNAKSETIPTEFSHIEDTEGRTEITTDAEDKILGYRDSEGTRHEHKISTNHLELSDDAANEINEAFKSAGIKMENPSDFSNDSHIELPIPRIIAQVYLYSPDIPAKYKGQNIKGEIEYNDKDGNYFRKKVTVNAQGDSSLYYPIRNMSIDIDDGCKIKFGDFPSQDSFHLKKYYIDVFRGQCIVGYRLTEQVYKSHPLGKQYPYEYNYTNASTTGGIGNIKKDFFSGAKCHPDGFPIWITWINTITNEKKELGVFTWNLKKSKEVYQCDKKKAENIILDGIISDRTLFGGSISWNSFEVRNPKSLKDIDENKYDGDSPKELSNTDSLSKKTKEFILRLSSVNQQLEASKTKETFESFFLVAPFIDYLLVSYILFHYDGFEKNWIWVTYDGLKWTPTLYDMDSIFGNNVRGTGIVEKSDTELLPEEVDNHNQYCLKVLKELYSTEIKSRYKELRDKKIFDIDNIYGLLSNWLQKIGFDNLAKDLEIFKETPSYRDGSIEYTEMPTTGGFFNSPKRVYNWLNNRILFLDSKFNYKK